MTMKYFVTLPRYVRVTDEPPTAEDVVHSRREANSAEDLLPLTRYVKHPRYAPIVVEADHPIEAVARVMQLPDFDWQTYIAPDLTDDRHLFVWTVLQLGHIEPELVFTSVKWEPNVIFYQEPSQ